MDDNTAAVIAVLGVAAIVALLYIYLAKPTLTSFTRDKEGRIIEIIEKKL